MHCYIPVFLITSAMGWILQQEGDSVGRVVQQYSFVFSCLTFLLFSFLSVLISSYLSIVLLHVFQSYCPCLQFSNTIFFLYLVLLVSPFSYVPAFSSCHLSVWKSCCHLALPCLDCPYLDCLNIIVLLCSCFFCLHFWKFQWYLCNVFKLSGNVFVSLGCNKFI